MVRSVDVFVVNVTLLCSSDDWAEVMVTTSHNAEVTELEAGQSYAFRSGIELYTNTQSLVVHDLCLLYRVRAENEVGRSDSCAELAQPVATPEKQPPKSETHLSLERNFVQCLVASLQPFLLPLATCA